MRRLVCTISIFTCALLLGAQTQQDLGPQPTPPTKPIAVFTQIGTVASMKEKAQLSLLATISPTVRTLQLTIKETATFGLSEEVQFDRIQALARVLERASEAANDGRSFTETSGSVTVATAHSDLGEAFLILKFKKEGLSMTSDSIQFNPDNAFLLSRMLVRAYRVGLWLKPRLAALYPKSKLPLTIKQG